MNENLHPLVNEPNRSILNLLPIRKVRCNEVKDRNKKDLEPQNNLSNLADSKLKISLSRKWYTKSISDALIQPTPFIFYKLQKSKQTNPESLSRSL